MKMDQAMAAAIGINAADTWVRKMIEHHRGAVDMSRIVLTQSPTADVAKMAQSTIDEQGKGERLQMVRKVNAWRDSRASTPRSADMGVGVPRALLRFGRERAAVRVNVADGIRALYRGGAEPKSFGPTMISRLSPPRRSSSVKSTLPTASA